MVHTCHLEALSHHIRNIYLSSDVDSSTPLYSRSYARLSGSRGLLNPTRDGQSLKEILQPNHLEDKEWEEIMQHHQPGHS